MEKNMKKLESNEVEKVSGGSFDFRKLGPIKGPLDSERVCESCGKTFICHHYNGIRPIGPIFDRKVEFAQFRFDHRGQFCSECMKNKFDSIWERQHNALKNDHRNEQ